MLLDRACCPPSTDFPGFRAARGASAAATQTCAVFLKAGRGTGLEPRRKPSVVVLCVSLVAGLLHGHIPVQMLHLPPEALTENASPRTS